MGLNNNESASRSDGAQPSEQTSHSPGSVNLHIEEMVLHGFPGADRYRIGDAAQQELSRLLNERDDTDAFLQNAYHQNIDAGSIQVEPGMTPEVMGLIIAQALHRGFRI